MYCGAFADHTPEGIAAFSTGPQFQLMKDQNRAVNELLAEVRALRNLITTVSAIGALGFIALLMMVLWIIDHWSYY